MSNANNQHNSNMALWHSVCITDPTQTTEIKGKPYKGTSPKAYWLIQRATETFGPIGQGWGVDIKEHGFQKLDDVTICHWIIIILWYMKDGQKCCIEQSGGSKAMYKASTGMVHDEDAIKKSKTNATVKALSLLGFAGDIHAGYWNAPGYQQKAREYFYGPINNAANDSQAQQQSQTQQQAPVDPLPARRFLGPARRQGVDDQRPGIGRGDEEDRHQGHRQGRGDRRARQVFQEVEQGCRQVRLHRLRNGPARCAEVQAHG